MLQAQPFPPDSRQAELDRYPVSLQIAGRAVFSGRHPDLGDLGPVRMAVTAHPRSL